MTKQNPFASHRWETEVEHRIWIPPEAAKVASTKACLISGLRGTGKTALLNCLDRLAPQRERIRFLNPEALQDSCIGVYISIIKEFTDFLPLMSVDGEKLSFDGEDERRTHALAFRTYLIFTSLARALEVTDECRRYGVLDYPGQCELEFASSFNDLLLKHFENPPQERPARTLLECASTLLKVCMAVRVNSLRLYGERVIKLIGDVQPAKFYADFCGNIQQHRLLNTANLNHHIKISLDDVHRFGRVEQALLNSLLEINTAPITWNLSFVTGQYDPTISPDPNAPLTRHDVERVDLNYEENQRGFRRLCKKLYDTRLGIQDDEKDEDGGYSRVLGNPNVSFLFLEMFQATASEAFRDKIFAQLEYVADKLSAVERAAGRGRHRKSDRRRYLYQTYIFLVLFGGKRDRFEKFLSSRTHAQIDNYFRQKNIAALVAAANELGRSAPYAGTNALIALSDGCIRDFLLILAILYENTNSTAQVKHQSTGSINFFSAEDDRVIPIYEQSRSFVQASHSYLEQIEESTNRVGRVLSSLVDGVAHLTRLLQSQDPLKALALPERGQILLNFAETTLVGDAADRIALLRRALAMGQFVGAIRILRGVALSGTAAPNTDQMLFRLHRLVAPAHNYSSRGPLRAIYLPLRAALEFTEDRPVQAKNWAERVFSEIHDLDAGDESADQQELFS
jgi:hypothetical protein